VSRRRYQSVGACRRWLNAKEVGRVDNSADISNSCWSRRLSVVYSTYRPVVSALMPSHTHPLLAARHISCRLQLLPLFRPCLVSLTLFDVHFNNLTSQLPIMSQQKKQNFRDQQNQLAYCCVWNVHFCIR